MTRQEADQIVVFLSSMYGPWSDLKKASFAELISDLPFDRAQEAAKEWVKNRADGKWPLPGDIRAGVNQIIGRQGQLRLTDERRSGVPVPRKEGIENLRKMREALALKGGERREGIQKVGDMLGRRVEERRGRGEEGVSRPAKT